MKTFSFLEPPCFVEATADDSGVRFFPSSFFVFRYVENFKQY